MSTWSGSPSWWRSACKRPGSVRRWRLSAYFLKGVVPEWDLKDIYLGMMQFMVIQLIGLALVFAFPVIALGCQHISMETDNKELARKPTWPGPT